MKIKIICIGKTNEPYVKNGLEKYLKLLSKYGKIEWIELPDAKNANKLPPEKLKDAEAELILPHLKNANCVVLLDEKGKNPDSVQFAHWLGSKSDSGAHLVFVIGGAYGFNETIKMDAELISLSAMTFNHQMVRVILTEQLFRAFTILKGSSYHH